MAAADPSGEQLEVYGYKQTLKREFNFFQASAIGFADISPIVALYGTFALALAVAGPAAWWGYFLVFAGQLLVCLVFMEVASSWPLAGGVYQWTRQQVGVNTAWFAGWAYTWTGIIGMSAIAFGAASFFCSTFGIANPSTNLLILISVCFIVFATIANTISQMFLKVLVVLSIIAELTASILVGIILLIGYRENPFSVVFDSYSVHPDNYFVYAWLGAVAFIGYAFIGWEASGAIGEEVKEPHRAVPFSLLAVLASVGLVVIFTSLALIIANPDIQASLTGDVTDPVQSTLEYHFGDWITRPFLLMITIGFTASLVAVQTAVSRVVFSFGRDRMFIGGSLLDVITKEKKLPVRAIVLVGVISSAFLFLNFGLAKVFQTLITFVIAGMYISFAFPVLAALYLHTKKRHVRGPIDFGRWSMPIAITASLFLILELINVAWPRYSDLPWYQNWGVILMTVTLSVLAVVIYYTAPSRDIDEKNAVDTPPIS